MHKLVAIEPTAFDGYQDLNYLFSKFGFHEGRLVAEYPKRWRHMVYEHLERLPDWERQRSVVLLAKYAGPLSATRKTFRSGSLPYNSENQWVDNARNRLAAGEVAGVIVPRDSDSKFPSPDVDDEYFFAICGRQAEVLATSEGYSEAARILLMESSEVAIVDPYLSSFRANYKKVLDSFARVAMEGKMCRRFICYSIDRKSSRKQIECGARSFFSDMVGAGISVSYRVIHDGGDLNADDHGRFLISKVGAMAFDKGFEEEQDRKLRKVFLLDPPMHNKLRSQYLEDDLPFEQIHRFDFNAADEMSAR